MEDLNEIFNLEKYPINDTGSLKYRELTNYTRKQLNEDGCCVLPNFIRPDSIRKMKDEVDRNLSKIYFTSDKHNPYFTKDDKTLPEDHPKRIFTVRQSGYLNSDDLEKNSDLNKFLDKMTNSNIIINCAANLNPKTARDFFINQDFPHILQTHIKKKKKKIVLIHISSINVLIRDRKDPYTISKKIAEKKLKGTNLIILRLPFLLKIFFFF